MFDYGWFNKNYKLIVADHSNQKVLDADPRGIQQIAFTGEGRKKSLIYYILEPSKKTVLEFYKGTGKVLWVA